MNHEKSVLNALYQLSWAQVHINNFAGHSSIENDSLKLAEVYAKEALRTIRDIKDAEAKI